MFVQLFIIGCLVQGLVCNDEDHYEESCDSLSEEYEESDGIPNAEQLIALCPKLLDVLECEERLIIADDKEYLLSYIRSLKHIATDLCETDSRLQKAYLASVDCFRHMKNEWPDCYNLAQDVYLDFRKFITSVGENESDDLDEQEEASITYMEPFCVMNTYSLACLSNKMLESCGLEAQETFVEILRRTQYITRFCMEEEINRLKKEFLDFLMSDPHAKITAFREVFDFRKK